MRIAMTAFVLVSVTMVTAGCGGFKAPVEPPQALIYTNISGPMDYNVHETKTGPGLKSGEATVSQVLGMVSTGDASITAAARQGQITKIHSVDYKFKSYVLGVYSKFTTVVWGE